MTRSDYAAVTDAATAPRPPRKALLWTLGALALVIAVGGVWTFGRIGATPPAVVDVTMTDTHAASPAAAHGAADADGGHDAAHAAEAAVAPAPHGHDESAAHDAPAAHDEIEASHTNGGHAGEAVAVPAATKQIVLGSFASVNAFAILAAAILRRRYPPRLPKHLQR
jgi:hypothetical protein